MANECLIMSFFWKALFLTINKNNFPKKITHKTWKQPKNKTHIIWVKSSNYPKSWFFQKKNAWVKKHFPDPKPPAFWMTADLCTARWYYKHWRMVHGARPASRPGSGTVTHRRCEVWKAVHGEYDIIYAYYQEQKDMKKNTPLAHLGSLPLLLLKKNTIWVEEKLYLRATRINFTCKIQLFNSPRRSYQSCHPSCWPANKLPSAPLK